MSLFNPHDLRNVLQTDQRILGIDPGSKTIGVAVTDVSLMLASPLIGLKRRKLGENAKELADIVKRQEVGAIVVGLPLSLDGSFGPAARAASDWTTALSERLGLPACLWDERLSSSAVNRFLIQDADMTRGRRAEVVDKMAAAYMLQGWLDATKSEPVQSFFQD
ncbi:crossover junction endodeoxyribonuclease RuvA [Gluconobacter oxydans]|uniref:Holliday junction resolvase RuvX n=1 Tax=Gluconobacter thailandicus TaxID=257438 RepID=UPI0002996FA1|nr:Holliday junction resolvase RuvX [Gluconobacter thailandicus]AFW02211.1 DNA integration/recombination/inversion protein [Gluconobacter oxydans H24]ANQ42258.1 crossover junction endodeoxyribonuclease RuvA [Gluconobacter oxydans]